MAWPASGPGRLLERCGDVAPRGMTVHDKTRLIGRLRRFFRHDEKSPKVCSAHLGPRATSAQFPAAVRPPSWRAPSGPLRFNVRNRSCDSFRRAPFTKGGCASRRLAWGGIQSARAVEPPHGWLPHVLAPRAATHGVALPSLAPRAATHGVALPSLAPRAATHGVALPSLAPRAATHGVALPSLAPRAATHGVALPSLAPRAATRGVALPSLAPRAATRGVARPADQPPYRAFLGAPVSSAASLAAVDGGRCSLSLAYMRRPAAN